VSVHKFGNLSISIRDTLTINCQINH